MRPRVVHVHVEGFRGGIDLVVKLVSPGSDDLLQIVVAEIAVVKCVVSRVNGVLSVWRGPLNHRGARRLIARVLLPKRNVSSIREPELNRPLSVELRRRENSGLGVVVKTVNQRM